MRMYLCVFLVAWLFGIMIGVYELSTTWALVIGGMYLVWLTLTGLKHQYITAVAFLLLAGAMWGQHSLAGNETSDACSLEAVSEGVVTKVVRLEGDNAQYLLNTPAGCRVLVTTMPWPLYGVGSTLIVDGMSESVLDVADEYPEYAKYLLSQGISSTMYRPDISITETTDSWQNKVITVLREQTGKVFQEPVTGLVLTMTLGQKGSLSDRIVEQFRRTGTSHVLAISGLHMSLFAGMLLAVLLLFPLSPLMRVTIVIGLLWMYVAVIGFPISALRAVWFWTLVLVSLRLGWLVSLPTVILLTSTLLISFNPLVIQEVGFQLSISAIIGIGITIFLVRGLPRHHVINSYRSFLDLIIISLGATLTTAPIVMYHFGQISLVSVLGNLVVVPLVPLFLAVTIVALVSSFIVPSVTLMISFGIHLIWKWWDLWTSFIASIPGVYFDNIDISLYVVIIYYLSFFIGSHFIVKKQRRNWREMWQ